MPRFFCRVIANGQIRITGADAHHIGRVLRMRVGEELTVCDEQGTDYRGVIASIAPQEVMLDVIDTSPTLSEPSLQVTLYQGVPKSDKMDWIIQKTVELGIARIVPVQTARSIARADGDRSTKKQERWQRIAAEAAGQSGRGKIPAVSAPLSWVQMLAELEPAHTLVFYEGGGQPLTTLVSRDSARLNMIVGPEGGFAPEEIEELVTRGVIPATLGKRILRCETAPVAALAAVMCLSGNME